MSSNPLVSLITPSFNRGNIIRETAESILKQSYLNWEWVIVDDGSTDNSWEVLELLSKQDSRIKIFQRDRDPKGACTCRNIGVKESKGSFLIFLDTDDLLASFCLEQRVSKMIENPSLDFAIFSMLLFKNNPTDLKLLWNIESSVDDVLRIFYQDPICQGTGTIWKKNTFVLCGMWDENLLLWQDIDLHFRAFLKNFNYKKYLDLPPDTFIRVSDISLSRTGYHSLPKYKSRLIVFEKVLQIIKENGSFEKYLPGIRHLYIDLFLNASRNRFKNELDELQKLHYKYKIIEAEYFKHFRNYIIAEKLKLNRIKWIKDFMISRVELSDSKINTTLGSILYKKTIKI